MCSVFRVADGDIKKDFKKPKEIFEYLHLAAGAARSYRAPCGYRLLGAGRQIGGSFRLAKSFRRAGAAGAYFQIAGKPGAGDRSPFSAAATAARLMRGWSPHWLLARKARRPVQWGFDPEEVLPQQALCALVKIKTGVKRDGAIVARRVEVFYGAYALNGPVNAKTGCYVSSGPYNIPNRSLSTYSVYTNCRPPVRIAVGVSHVCWAYESEMDDIARGLAWIL